MKKSVKINGKVTKVDFELIRSNWRTVKENPKPFDSNTEHDVSMVIDGVNYPNVFICATNVTTSGFHQGRQSRVYRCAKTGKKFTDSEKKMIEYLLN